MKRPFFVWLAFAACAAVGCGVLGWFTREMLRLEHESSEARRVAGIEENVRLALWRMDSALASVHGLEAARPWQEYESFYRADAAFSAEFSPLPPGNVMLPSPLLAYTPPFVRLHFQLEADGTIRSPQAPPAALRPAALSAGITAEQLDGTAVTLLEFQGGLDAHALAAALPSLAAVPAPVPELKDKTYPDESRAKALVSKIELQRAEIAADARQAENERAPPATAAPQAPLVNSSRDEIQIQQLKSAAEQHERANTLAASNVYNADAAENRRAQAPLQLAGDSTAAGIRPDDATANERARGSGQETAPVLFGSRPAPARAAAGVPAQAGAVGADRAERDDSTTTSAREADATAAAGPQSQTLLADAAKPDAAPFAQKSASAAALNFSPSSGGMQGPLQAVWSGDELVFARRAVIDGREVIQGAWLDWPELRAWLLSRVSDLLPQAQLERARPGAATTAFDAARRLAFLPVQLVPGVVPVDSGSLASPLRLSLGTAWMGAIVGLVALALLLRGTLRLSERRGAFVSAVTHELRTPLTTFRMYTEMLASGMVTDETKRRGYVATLHQESERLSHLVENVLSYARLERGRAASRIEDTTPGVLLARIEERLRQRAHQGGLAVRVEFAGGTADLPLHTDVTAVEQILFNLVDNATKYGRRRGTGAGVGDAGPAATGPATADAPAGEISIRVALFTPHRLAIRVADQGPGLTAAARKRLFQPFSKSATEAAHSQPGVGLGLALCRRLARDELHGELALERTGADGTVFRLELPMG